MKSKDESIAQLEKAIQERSASIASLQSEIKSLQVSLLQDTLFCLTKTFFKIAVNIPGYVFACAEEGLR